MNPLFTIEDTLPNKIGYYHILFFLITLPFDRFYCEVILVSFTIHTLIHLKKFRLKNIFTKEVLILQSIYLITIFGTLYTLNTKQAISDWGRQLIIFLFPVLFSISEFSFRKYRTQLLLSFSFSFALIILYLYLDALHVITYNHLPAKTLLSPYFINHNFSKPIDMHATYLSLYVALALNFFLLFLFRKTSGSQKALYIFCIFILTCGLVQLASKSVIIAELFIINLGIPVFYFTGIKRIKLLAVTWFATAIVVLTILNIGSLRERYFDDLNSDLRAEPPVHQIADTRMERWNIALNLIKASPVVGYGSGDEVDLLKEKYFENKLYDSYLHRLNAHNQYLSFLIKGGIVGLLVYLFTLLYGLTICIKTKDMLFVCFLILVTTVSLSESFLDANKGVFFYSFFFSFFIFCNKGLDQAHLSY